MNSGIRAAIAGTGIYLPERVLTNGELERLVETSHDWIVERTGIRERRIAAPHESTSSMAIEAARRACADADLDPAELDAIIVATVTPDYFFPATACLVQDALGATRAGAFDLSAACSGFVYGTAVASGLISSGAHRAVLVIGADSLSRVVDYNDRRTCILFGDGAGAVVYRGRDDGSGVLRTILRADGSQREMIQIRGGGSKHPATHDTVDAGMHYIEIIGRRVFKFATGAFVHLLRDIMDDCHLTPGDVTLVIPHQVNERIIEAAMKRSSVPREKCFINIDRYGNTSAASIPIALHEARDQGLLPAQSVAVMLGFGAGLTSAAAVVRF